MIISRKEMKKITYAKQVYFTVFEEYWCILMNELPLWCCCKIIVERKKLCSG